MSPELACRSPQSGELYRLSQENSGAIAELRREVAGACGGEDHGNLWVVTGKALEGLSTIFGQHVEVEQSEVNRELAGEGQHLPAVGGRHDEVALGDEVVSEGVEPSGLFIHDEQAS